jgi:hypothetical protein
MTTLISCKITGAVFTLTMITNNNYFTIDLLKLLLFNQNKYQLD